MRKFLHLVLPLAILASPAASDVAQLDGLWAAIRVHDFVAVMAKEGVSHGEELEDALFPGEGGRQWREAVAEIYDTGAMATTLRAGFEEALADRDVAGAIAFFEAPLGARSIALEISAREAMLDPDIEEASYDALDRMIAEGDPRLELIADYSDANALVDNNVVGAMNSNYAFLLAMADAGQGPFANDTGSILSEVWSQEHDIRVETEAWAMSYFAFAYGPLEDADLKDLIGFSRSPAGRAVNTVIFSAFDHLLVDLSEKTGRAAAEFMAGERL